ncbi:MAG: PQQ-binding-like beta-propeller repeat protein [Thermoguttaceae bacterium]
MKKIYYAVIAILVLAGTTIAAQPSWPVFHGPKGNNISPATGLLTTWPEEGPKLIWKCDKLGEGVGGYSGVTVKDGRVYTSGNVADGDEVYSTVFCLDEKDGKILWTYKNGPAWTNGRMFPGTRSTPTIDGDFVYDETPVGQVACIEAKTGKEVWSVNILEEFDAKNITWALAESVIIDGDNVICAPGGEKASVAALDKKTGKVVWTTPSTGELTNYATPYIFDFEGFRVIAIMNQKGIIGVNAKDGKLLFSVPHETKYDINATMPHYNGDGTLFVISGYGTGSQLLKLAKDGDVIKAEQVWAKKEFDNQHGGIVVIDGFAYGTTQNYKGGVWVCQKVADGEIMWEDKGVGKGACTSAEGLIYGMSEGDGTVGIFEATPEGYKEHSRFKLPEEGEGMYWAHPVVCGKNLYLRHGNFLYVYDIGR